MTDSEPKGADMHRRLRGPIDSPIQIRPAKVVLLDARRRARREQLRPTD